MTSTRLEPTPARTDGARALLRHIVATLAYRGAKVLRDVPDSFAQFSLTGHTRQPVRIVAHMNDLADWALWLARGEYIWRGHEPAAWRVEVQGFFDRLTALDAYLASDAPLGCAAEMIFQGPLADAHTHVGQLAMLRGAAGIPVRPESYARAAIESGRVGLDQPAPRSEFDGDASEYRVGQ